MRTMTVTADQRKITDFEKTLDAAIAPTKPAPKHCWMLSGNVEERRGIQTNTALFFAIGLDDFAEISADPEMKSSLVSPTEPP